MAESNQCSGCGSSSLVFGTMQSTGAVRFRPVDAKFLVFRTADITVRAGMCPDCGQVTLFGDQEKLRALASSSETARST